MGRKGAARRKMSAKEEISSKLIEFRYIFNDSYNVHIVIFAISLSK